MRPQDVIGLKAANGWKPAIGFLREWRRVGASPALPPALVVADPEGRPTAAFLGLYRDALGASLRPAVQIIENGRPTVAFLDLWEAAT